MGSFLMFATSCSRPPLLGLTVGRGSGDKGAAKEEVAACWIGQVYV